jgi:alcohol dehydrogenase
MNTGPERPQAAHPATTRRGHGVTADGEFFMPTRVFFGRGVSSHAGHHAARLAGRRVILVTDPGVQNSGIADPVRDGLVAAGLEAEVFQQVEPNPKDQDCLAGAELAAEFQAEGLVAVGGGSAIDTAKCIALLRTNGGHPRDWEDFGALRNDPLPVLAIPTTAGTGSEVSPSAVITDTERKKKMNLFDMRNCPKIALVDPDLTLSCPPSLTAAAGMDALSHAVDSLHCRLATPASDALALEGARLVAQYIRQAVGSPGDIEARCGMAQGSLTAGIAVGLTDVAGVHCLAEAIGGLYGHPHGYCCADSMPPVMEYNLPVSSEKYARLARAFGIAAGGSSEAELARLAIEYIRQLNRDLDVPPMRQLILSEDLELLGQKAEQNTSTPSNPRPADAAAFAAMFAREIGP